MWIIGVTGDPDELVGDIIKRFRMVKHGRIPGGERLRHEETSSHICRIDLLVPEPSLVRPWLLLELSFQRIRRSKEFSFPVF